jgi:hypothetical protein
VSEEKLLYKQFLDDNESDTFEEFLTKRLLSANKEVEELKAELHRKSVKYSATLERDEKMKAYYREQITLARRELIYGSLDKAKKILGDAIGEDEA